MREGIQGKPGGRHTCCMWARPRWGWASKGMGLTGESLGGKGSNQDSRTETHGGQQHEPLGEGETFFWRAQKAREEDALYL